MLNLTKALYTDIETELFNTFLHTILTDKKINFQNELPTVRVITSHFNPEFYNETILYYDIPNDTNLYMKISYNMERKHNFKLHVRSIDNKITQLAVFFYNERTGTNISLDLDRLTKSNIKILLSLYKKHTKINFGKHSYKN